MLPKTKHPVYKTTLPSSGETVSYRAMQGREEKILLMAKETEDTKEILSTVMQVVNNCVMDLDISDLPIFDIEWLFIQIRIASVGATSPVSYIDRSDNKRYDFVVDLKNVTVKKNETVDTIAVDEQVGIGLRWPPAKAFISPRVINLTSDAEIAHEMAVACVGEVYDGDQVVRARDTTDAEIDEFVSSLPLESYQKLLDHVSMTPSLWYEIKYTNSVGEEREIVLSNLTDFFRFR